MEKVKEIPPVRKPVKKKTPKDNTKKKETKKKKRTPEEQEELKGRILERVAREEKAYRIVERFLENPISSSLLKKALSYINQDVYNDIVEERSILKLCGYPICLGKLPAQIRKQTWAIDRRTNKVYKLEERVKYCSDRCYSISRSLRDSLSPEPVWMIPRGAHKDIVVVSVREEGEVVEEALPSNQKIPDIHLGEVDQRDTKFSNTVPGEGYIGVKPVSGRVIEEQFEGLGISDSEEEEEGEGEISIFDRVRRTLQKIKTEDSVTFLLSNPTTLDSDDDSDGEGDDEGLLDEDLKIEGSCPPSRAPIPNLEDLSGSGVEVKESINQETETCIVLPSVDSVNQGRLRRTLVLSKMQRA
eukprot:sb/3466092/